MIRGRENMNVPESFGHRTRFRPTSINDKSMSHKSIYRQEGSRHFQLVHRSRRDPLFNNPAASQHVLKPKFQSQGNMKQRIQETDDTDKLACDLMRANIGEATNYGIFYDDTEYDYMQHLRPVGIQEDGVESTLIEAPAQPARGVKRIAPDNIPVKSGFLRDIPPEALPSAIELTHEEVLSAQAIALTEPTRLHPYMDPHLRQTLEALEDDVFIDSSLDDGFFAELVAAGERGSEDKNFPFAEDGIDNIRAWESRFAKFKTNERASKDRSLEREELPLNYSQDEDVISKLRASDIVKTATCGNAESIASDYSTSSLSLHRNEGLALLDEQFDYIQKEYALDEDGSNSEDEVPDLITARADFNEILDGFLDNYEDLGRRVRLAPCRYINEEKHRIIRDAPRDADYLRSGYLGDEIVECIADEREENDDANFWDCETILGTTSKRLSHPKVIRATETKVSPKIYSKMGGRPIKMSDRSVISLDGEPKTHGTRITVKRTDGETKEEKRLRKGEVKEERRKRRIERKTTRALFSGEKKKAHQALAHTPSIEIRKL